jgi:hypothetical protein
LRMRSRVMSDGRVTPGSHFSNPRLNLMSHYDDFAADNFASVGCSGCFRLNPANK